MCGLTSSVWSRDWDRAGGRQKRWKNSSPVPLLHQQNHWLLCEGDKGKENDREMREEETQCLCLSDLDNDQRLSHTITHTHTVTHTHTHTGWQKRSTKGCNNDYVKIKYTRISFQLSLHVFTVERLQWNRIESMNTSFFPRLLVKLATRRYRKRQHIISVLMLQFYATIAEKQQISLLKVEYHLTQLLSRKGYVNACAVNV